MIRFQHNEAWFALVPNGAAWDVLRSRPDGGGVPLGTNLFPGLSAENAEARARALVRIVHPVGVRIVGPDVTHATRVGDLRIVGPDVTHPTFIHWDAPTTSFPSR